MLSLRRLTLSLFTCCLSLDSDVNNMAELETSNFETTDEDLRKTSSSAGKDFELVSSSGKTFRVKKDLLQNSS